MGFFGKLFGSKKQGKSTPARERRRWSFSRSSNQPSSQSGKRDSPQAPAAEDDGLDSNKHAIAVAAATAAVAEAALAAAHAAAEVVRLTSGTGGRSGGGSSAAQIGGSNRRWVHEYLAAVKIQSAFRGYLARRALRALKALVKLQALVRGHIVRKQTADMLRRMQTLVRLQARARARAARASHISDSFHSPALSYSSSHSHHSRCVSNAELRDIVLTDHRSQGGSNRLDHWSEETFWDNKNNRRDRHSAPLHDIDDKSDKILEVDTWKPRLASRTFQSDHHLHHHAMALNFESPRKKSSLRMINPDPAFSRSTENSPQVHSACSRPGSSGGGSRRRSPFTPTRSEYSWGYFGNYSGYYPNYMANTESYRAKVRSQSAPRQRLEFSSDGGYGYGFGGLANKRSMEGHYYYYAAAERSFDQRSDIGNVGYREISDRLNRNPSGRSR